MQGEGDITLKSNPRVELGLLLRSCREKRRWSRQSLQKKSGVGLQTIKNLEHGTPNPTREDFLRIIKVLAMSSENEKRARGMLRIIHPRKWQQRKFHLPSFLLRHPNRQSYC